MALSKLSTIALSVTGVVATTAAITTGVVVSQNNRQETGDTDHSMVVVPTEEEKLQKALMVYMSAINENSVVVNKQNTETPLKDHYAFNVKANELNVAKSVNNEYGFSTVFTYKNKPSLVDLNNGEIDVELSIKKDDKELAKKELKLNTFKKADVTVFEKLLDKESNEINKTLLSLTLTPQTQTELVTVEELNKEAAVGTTDVNTPASVTMPGGLTEWLTKSNKTENDRKDVSIVAKVKVNGISKVQDKTYFDLVSATQDDYIKLVKKGTENNSDSELLIESIKTTNLKASNITVIPVGIDNDATAMLTKEMASLPAGDGNNKAYKKENNQLFVEVKEGAEGTSSSDVLVNPYVITNTTNMATTKFTVNVNVAFGKDDYLTVFNTSDNNQAMQLKNGGFKFQVFSKLLTETEDVIKANVLNSESNKLNDYFKASNYTTPFAMATGDMKENDKGMFYVSSYTNENVEKPLEIMLESSSTKEIVEMLNKAPSPKSKNIVLFANYSYLGLMNNNVLLTPSVSLFHIKEPLMIQ